MNIVYMCILLLNMYLLAKYFDCMEGIFPSYKLKNLDGEVFQFIGD